MTLPAARQKWLRVISVFLGLLLYGAQPVFAQEERQVAKSLDELLELIEAARLNESKAQRQRERQFLASKDQQAAMLEQAEKEKQRTEARAVELEKTFAENERQLELMRAQMQERLGALKELFGHISVAAGDTAERLEHSLIAAQYPERAGPMKALVAKMSSESRLPSVEEIESLAYEMSRELIDAGRISRFSRPVITLEGEQQTRELVRVGLFNLVSDGRYLYFDADSGLVAELPRQPRGLAGSARALQAAQEGLVPLVIDPSGPMGGDLLRAQADRPGLVEKWHQGGLIGYVISGLGVVALVLALWRAAVLRSMFARVGRQLYSETVDCHNPLGRVLSVAEGHAGLDAESMELVLHEAILKERPVIEYALNLLKIIAMIAPLLGLLGTVVGMILVFQQITIFGAGDPKQMAGGISQALVTTVLGLLVAIPVLLLHTWVSASARKVMQVLEEQSAGLVALRTGPKARGEP